MIYFHLLCKVIVTIRVRQVLTQLLRKGNGNNMLILQNLKQIFNTRLRNHT